MTHGLKHRYSAARLILVISLSVGLAWIGYSTGRVAAEPQKPALASGIKTYAVRLKPGDDVKKSLIEFARNHGLKAPAILTCVGSLTDVNLRLANQSNGTARHGYFEIVSLVGMIDPPGGHLHLSAADKDGMTFGGHVLDGCLVYTTAEIVIAELVDLEFKREEDKTFGYKELAVYPRTPR